MYYELVWLDLDHNKSIRISTHGPQRSAMVCELDIVCKCMRSRGKACAGFALAFEMPTELEKVITLTYISLQLNSRKLYGMAMN